MAHSRGAAASIEHRHGDQPEDQQARETVRAALAAGEIEKAYTCFSAWISDEFSCSEFEDGPFAGALA